MNGAYVVIFSSKLRQDHPDYHEMGERMVALVAQQDGFLGMDSARDAQGLGITVSYWQSLEAITRWRDNVLHGEAQRLGRERWYECFTIRIAQVIGERSWPGLS